MKRILGTVAAFAAVLAFGTVSRAALITYDVSGSGSVNSVSSYAGATGNPPGIPWIFSRKFLPGSSITINTDTNGDSIVGDVSIVGGSLKVHANYTIATLGDLIVDYTTTLGPGGSGTLTGSTILWSTGPGGPVYVASPSVVPGSPYPPGFATVNWFGCTNASSPGLCGALGFPPGYQVPIASLRAVTMTFQVNPIILGEWDLSGDLSTILASTRATTGLAGDTAVPLPGGDPNFGPGQPSDWILFGNGDLGHTIPEPSALALVLLGIGGLALRSRKA